MTVTELIKALSDYDGDLPVSLGYDGRDPVMGTYSSCGTHDEELMVCLSIDVGGNVGVNSDKTEQEYNEYLSSRSKP